MTTVSSGVLLICTFIEKLFTHLLRYLFYIMGEIICKYNYDHNFPYSLMSYWLIFDIDLQMIPPVVVQVLLMYKSFASICNCYNIVWKPRLVIFFGIIQIGIVFSYRYSHSLLDSAHDWFDTCLVVRSRRSTWSQRGFSFSEMMHRL